MGNKKYSQRKPKDNGDQKSDVAANSVVTGKDSMLKKLSWNSLSPKAQGRIVIFLPIVLLVAALISLTTWLPSYLRNKQDFYVRKSLVVRDAANMRHYMGTGNRVSMSNGTLILNDDSVEIGDSLFTVLSSQYFSEQKIDNTAIPIIEEIEKQIQDSIIIAEVKKDLVLRSKGNGNVLYTREKERFLVQQSESGRDSITIRFNKVDFMVQASDVMLDTLPATDYEQPPFKLMCALRDNDNQHIVVRLNRLDVPEDTASQKAAITIFPLYGDKALGRVQKADTTYIFDSVDNFESSEPSMLRISLNNKLSYALTIEDANVLTVTKDSITPTPIYANWKYLLTGCLCILFVLSLIVLFVYYRNKRTRNVEKQETINDLKERKESLKKEILQWFDELDSSKGNIGLYTFCKEARKEYSIASYNYDSDADIHWSKFYKNVKQYIESLENDDEEYDYIKNKEEQLEEVLEALSQSQETSNNQQDGTSGSITEPDPANEKEELQQKIEDLQAENSRKDKELSRKNAELERLRKVEQNQNEEIRKAKEKANEECEKRVLKAQEKANKDIAEANGKVRQANERAEAAEKKSREIRQEVTDQFKEEIEGLHAEIDKKKETINQTRKDLKETEENLDKKIKECDTISRELSNKTEALKGYAARITDVQPAGSYAKLIERLLQIGHDIEKSADKLLELDVDDYLLTKYITRYQKALHTIDMSQFATDVLNIANVQFVYKQQPLAKYDQREEKQFKESMKLFFFESYLDKYINAIMVFNETMAGLHHLIEGLTENDTKVFSQYREDMKKVFHDLEIEVHSVRIFDSITDNVDLRVDMRPLEFDCPSGTICQIDSCLVYLAGGNKPNDKIHVIVKE